MPPAVRQYLDGKDEKAIQLFLEFRDTALGAGTNVDEKVSRTMVAWKQKRTFATAYLNGRYLECSIDLLHAVDHPHLKAAFHTTKKVITNRFTLEPGETIDRQMRS